MTRVLEQAAKMYLELNEAAFADIDLHVDVSKKM